MAKPEEDLGKHIFARTPYDKMELPTNWDIDLEQDGDPGEWYFKEIGHHVGKALRIPVTVTMVVEKYDSAGKSIFTEEKFTDYLLIGYEGAGGY